jgi:DNA repair protein RadC
MAKAGSMKIGTVSEAAEILAPFCASIGSEALAVLHLAGDNRLLGVTLEPAGGPDIVELPIADILRKALGMRAAAIVIAHNHPSGDPSPSAADEEATRALARAAAGVDIRLQDHLIFAGAECRSFRSLGLL